MLFDVKRLAPNTAFDLAKLQDSKQEILVAYEDSKYKIYVGALLNEFDNFVDAKTFIDSKCA